MLQTVQVGTILVKESPLMPELLGLGLERYSGNWNLVRTLDCFALDRKIRTAGWNFFFMAAEVKAMFFRGDRGEENSKGVTSDLRESKTATLQCSRSHRNPHEALSRFVLYDRLGTLASYPAELLLERTKWAVDVADCDVEPVTG